LRNFHIKAELRDVPWYTDFYKTGHVSGGLKVTAKILAAFHEEATARGKTPIVTIIPTGLDLLYFSDRANWPYQSLIENLSLEDIQVFNFGTGIMLWLDGRDPCILFSHCSQHYNEQGYRVLAELAFALLKDERLLPKIKQQGSGSFSKKQGYELLPSFRD
jgi:hypothetical protein